MKWRVLPILVLIIMPLITQGSIVDEINRQIQEREAKRIELEKQAAQYQAVINQKKGEINSLNNQVAIFNARINKLQVEINITEDDIDQTELEIIQLAYGIDQASEDIDLNKANLAKVIQALYELDNTSQIEMILQSDDFSDFFSQMSYLQNLQDGVVEKVHNLQLLKVQMHDSKTSEEEKKERLEVLKSQLDSQKWTIASQRNAQASLLQKTKGEESQYQQMLKNIEAQKRSLLGDINRLIQQKSAELARLKELQEKPPSEFWASTNWYFKQNDPRWSNTTIGSSNSTMGDYGCAITSVAMIMNYHGVGITPGQLAKENIFSWDLIYWPRKWPASSADGGSMQCMNCPPPHSSAFDWFRLDREIGAGYPVIVFVRASGYSGGHYVVVHHKTNDGRYVVHDPMFGSNIYLDSTQVYISNLYNTTTYIDQMVIYH